MSELGQFAFGIAFQLARRVLASQETVDDPIVQANQTAGATVVLGENT